MKRRPTIQDLAHRAGVSVATVDRVLNARAPVRQETAQRVLAAAKSIGYHAVNLIGQRIDPQHPPVRLGVVLQKEKQAFYQNVQQAAIDAAATQPVMGEATVVFATGQAPADFAHLMAAFEGRVDAVAATAVADVAVTDVVERLEAANIPCFALFNDFAQGVRTSYIGLNNLKVGRIAAHMIATAVHQPGKVAVFIGGARWHGHELRETGFRSYFREFAPQVRVLETLINLETRQLTYEATLHLLKRHPDLRGIYCAGGGMEGAIAAIRECRAPGEVALVVNELTSESRHGLASRHVAMVIATPLDRIFADVFRFAAAARADPAGAVPGQHFLKPDLYLPESL